MVGIRGLEDLLEQGQCAVEGRQPLLLLAAQLQQDAIQPVAEKSMQLVSTHSQLSPVCCKSSPSLASGKERNVGSPCHEDGLSHLFPGFQTTPLPPCHFAPRSQPYLMKSVAMVKYQPLFSSIGI